MVEAAADANTCICGAHPNFVDAITAFQVFEKAGRNPSLFSNQFDDSIHFDLRSFRLLAIEFFEVLFKEDNFSFHEVN